MNSQNGEHSKKDGSTHTRHVYLALALAAPVVIVLALVLGIILTKRQMRGPYLQSLTPDGVWVVWDTPRPTTGRVEYGLDSKLGEAVEQAQATQHHEVQLSGLNPYTHYFYRVNGGQIYRFRTAGGPEQAVFSFAVYGDSREGAMTHRRVVAQIQKSEPDFVLYTGDMVEAGNCAGCWSDFFSVAGPLLHTTPFFPTLGNHEDDNPPTTRTQYFDLFHLPGNERWYAFDYGTVRFIALKADGYSADGGYFPSHEQLAWLESELAGNPQRWTFIFFHVGIFTSRSEDLLEVGTRQVLQPLFERYKVDAVFMGHHHGYERVLVNGIIYIVTAGGGAPLYDLTQPEPGSQAAAKAFHFVHLEVDGDRLSGQTIDLNGKLIDRFELEAR